MKKSEQEQLFTQTISKYKGTIYNVCYMFSKDQEEVSDLFQEVLINLWKGFGQFEGRSDMKTWVYRISLNTCITIDRKKKRSKAELDMDMNLFTDTDEDTLQVDMLHRRISQLKPFDRAIVLLWLEDISYDEIGAIVGISAKNVSVRLVRIREHLKKMR